MSSDAAPQDPIEQAEAEQAAREQALQRNRLQRLQEADDLAWLMGDPRGRRIVWRQLEEAGLYRSSFDPTSHAQASFAEGQRNVGLRLLASVMDHCPALYPVMQEENRARPHHPAADQ